MKKVILIISYVCIILSSLFFVGFKYNDDVMCGVVITVYDGDTIKLKTHDEEYKIRFNGIDAPEYDQKYGEEAKNYLTSLINEKDICIKIHGVDKYNRLLATVFYNAEDINYKMIKAGYAWHYKYYDSNKKYEYAELEAKNEKLGLWKDLMPVPPWDYRHNKKYTH
ncbi:MAG: hypothetical protein DBY32_09585 [Phascolarctobacterium sp.]|nr:MAG: hypothetical protein DBY32_09585 [Phascolarctobacterium sp.]